MTIYILDGQPIILTETEQRGMIELSREDPDDDRTRERSLRMILDMRENYPEDYDPRD